MVFPDVVTDESLARLMQVKGARLTSGPGRQYCLERRDTAVYISFEEESHRDLDSIERLKTQLPWTPRSVILLTVSRSEGSLFLAFEAANCMARRWKGFIDWGGLDQWKEWFHEWERSHPYRES